MRISSLALAVPILFAVSEARAVAIDLRDPSFAPAVRTNHLEVAHSSYEFRFDALQLPDLSHDGELSWYRDDGFGIIGRGPERDEISHPEVLRLSFGEEVFVDAILVANLFSEGPGPSPERGLYSLDGDLQWTEFAAAGGHRNGEQWIEVHALADSILFTTPRRETRPYRMRHEFSLAGIELYRETGPAVPEPGTALLYAMSVVVVGWRIRASA